MVWIHSMVQKRGRKAMGGSLGIVALLALSPLSAFADSPKETTSQEARPLSQEEAIQIAIRNNKPLRAAALRVGLRQGAVLERQAAFHPTLNSRFAVTHLDEGASVSFNNQNIELTKQTQKEITLNMLLPLDISGQIAAAVNQAQFEELAVRLGYNAARNNLVAQVKTDYNTIVRRKALIEVAESELANAKERLHISESKFKAGVFAQFDVLRAQTDVASAQEAMLQARNNLRLVYAQLWRTLGVEQFAPLTVEQAAFAPPSPGEETILQQEAQTNRPELLQAQIDIRAAERGIKLARRIVEPEFALSFGYAYQPDVGGFSPRTNSWQVGAVVRFALYDGGVAKARAQQAREATEIARVNLKNTQEQVSLEAHQAYLSVLTAQERIPVSEAALKQARESYRLAEVRFRSGVSVAPGGSPLLELNDAQAALTRAQTDQVNAQYDLINAYVALDRALGRYGYGEKPGIGSPNAMTDRREK